MEIQLNYMNDFSIIIPIYNEEENISKLIKKIYNILENNYNFEIIVVDDCSNDSSLLILKNFVFKKNFKIVVNKKNYGQSYSISKGIKSSKYETVVTIDGDGQNNPADIPEMLKIFFSDQNIDLLGGIRHRRKDLFIKLISSKIANYIRNMILRDGCKDTGCSLKIFKKRIFLTFPYFDGIHRFLPALFNGFGYKTLYIPVDHRNRIGGISKYGTLDRLFKGIKDIIRVRNIINNHTNAKLH